MNHSRISKTYRILTFCLAIIMLCTSSHWLSIAELQSFDGVPATPSDAVVAVATVSDATPVKEEVQHTLTQESDGQLQKSLYYKVHTDENDRPTGIDWIYQLTSTTGQGIRADLDFTLFAAQGLGAFVLEDIASGETVEATVSANDEIYTAHIESNEKRSEYLYKIYTPIVSDSDAYSIYIQSDVAKAVAPGEEMEVSARNIYTVPMGETWNRASASADNKLYIAEYAQDKSALDWTYFYIIGQESEATISMAADASHSMDMEPELILYRETPDGYVPEAYTSYDIDGTTLRLRDVQPGDMLRLHAHSMITNRESSHTLGDFTIDAGISKEVIGWEVVNDMDFIRSDILHADKDTYYTDGYGNFLEHEDRIASVQGMAATGDTVAGAPLEAEVASANVEEAIADGEILNDTDTSQTPPSDAPVIEIVSEEEELSLSVEDGLQVNHTANTQGNAEANMQADMPEDGEVYGEASSFTDIVSSLAGAEKAREVETIGADDRADILEGVDIKSEELTLLEDTTSEERLHVRLQYADETTSKPLDYRTLTRNADITIDKMSRSAGDVWELEMPGTTMLRYNTRITEWLPWQKIVLPTRKFGLSLGSYSEDADIQSTSVAIENGRPVITWTYTVRQTGGNANTPNSIKRYFSTSVDSGLGMPEIVSITKDGRNVKDPTKIATTITQQEGLLENSVREDASKDAGTYVYTIKTPVIAPRDYYVLDVNSYVEANLPRGARVTIDGETQTLSQNETIRANNMTRIGVKDVGYNDLKNHTENKVNLQTSFSASRTAAGDYDPRDPNKIRWVETQTNTTGTPQSYLFDLTPDDSQRFESMTLYYYKQGPNGYEIDNTKTTTLTTPVVNVDDVEPGYMVQAVAKTTVVDNKKKHSIIGASLDALYGDIVIEKQWTADATPKEVKFTLSGGSFNNEALTLAATDRVIIKQNVPKFRAVTANGTTTYERISYDIREQADATFELVNEGKDVENLHYTFTNRKKVSANSGTAPNTGQCKDYGVIDINDLELNQIWYTYNEFGWGSNLTGHFRIPANSKGGDKFVLKIDNRVRIVKEVSKTTPWFNIHGANRADGYTGTIGRVYHTAQNELTFELLNEATWSEDYEGTFIIGNNIPSNVISRLNGHNFNEAVDGKQYWGVVPNAATFKDASTTVNNIIPATLKYSSTYYGYNGDFTGCTREGNISARAHYEDQQAMDIADDVNKYVIEETMDSLTYEVVFNAAGENWGSRATNVWFVDRLSQTIQLYHGNSPSSLPLDIEWYRTDDGDRITGTYNPTTLVKIYPAPGSNPNANMEEVTAYPVNIDRKYAPANFNNGNVKFNYEVWFRPKNKGSSTFVMRMKVKKLESVGGYMYNEGEIWWQSGLAFRRTYNVHTPTVGIGWAEVGKLFSFHIKKLGKDGNASAVIDDKLTKFRIWNYSYSRKVETVNGIASFIDIPAGEYWLDETDPPEGYVGYKTEKKIVVNANGRITFKENGTERDLGVNPTINIVNTPGEPVIKPKRLHIRKVDEETGSLLRGAVFRLYTKNSREVSYDTTIGRNGNDNQNLSEFIFDGLDIKGKYILEEVAAPNGYQKKDTKRYFAFVKSGNNYILKEYTSDAFTTLATEQPFETDISFKIDYNNNRTNQVILKKVDNEGNPIPRDAMSAARFELWIAADNGTDTLLEDGTTVKLNKYESQPYRADAEGQLKFTNLPDNTYYVKEVVAPTGYMLPTTPIAKFLVYNRTLMGVDSLPILMKNTKKSRFIIKKTNTEGQVMQGVTFTLYSDENMTTSVTGITNPQVTDSNGRIEFAGLDTGTYYLKETATLAGYKLKEDKWRVRVEKNGQVSSTLIPAPTTGTSTRSAAMSRSAMDTGLSEDFLEEHAFNASLMNFYASGTERASGDTYRDAPEGVSRTENGITTSQTITKVSEGRYKVDVSITGAGMRNWYEQVDYVFMMENRPKPGYAALDTWGYRELIDGESWLAIETNPTVGIKAFSWVDGKRNIQNGDYRTTTAGRDFNVLYRHTNDELTAIKNAKPNGKRVVIFIHTLGIDRWGGSNSYNEIASIESSTTKNTFSQIRNRGDEVYVIMETVQGNRGTGVGGLTDLRPYYTQMGVPASNVFLLGERHGNFANDADLLKAYKTVLDPIMTKYPKKEAKLKITVADNMIFDTASGISNVSTNSASGYSITYDAASKSINASGLKFTADGRLTFSYYVRSNTESDRAVLEQFEDINSVAKYMREGLEYRSITIPVPEVKVPSRTISLERNWNDIEAGLRQSTNVSLVANIPRTGGSKTEQTLTYRDGSANFAPVPLFDNSGNHIRYTVRESDLSSALATDISYRIGTATNTTGIVGANGTAILSTRAGAISMTVKKIWQKTGADEQRPVRVRLLARTGNTSIDLATLGIRTAEVDLNTTNSWKHTFTGLPRYHNGSEVIYEVTELAMDGSTGFTGDYDVNYSYGNGQMNVINRKVHTIEVVNERIDAYDIKVTKKDKDNNNLNGARFAILSEDGQTIVGSNTSGQGGEQAGANPSFTFTRSGNHYQAGTYYIKEISAPGGYARITDLIKVVIGTDGNITVTLPENSKYTDYVSFTINRDGANPVIEVNIQNDRLFNLYIRKRSADEVNNSMGLPAIDADVITKLVAAFELKDANGASFTPAKTMRTDTQPQGYGRFDNLEPGEYVLEETTTPTGYITPEAYRIRIGRDGSITRLSGPDDLLSFMPNATDGWNNINMVVKNRPIKYDFRIIKKDETGTNTVTATARFAILNANGEIISGQQANTINGIANFANTNSTHFAPGNYKLREINAPDNYVRITEDLPFTIGTDGTVTMTIPENSPYRDFVQVNVNRNGAIPVIEFNVKNDPRSWNLIIRKRDKVEAGSTTNVGELDRLTKKPIATFELLQADGSPLTPRKVDSIDLSSKPQGYVRFDNIKPGRYKLRETEVPAGYVRPAADLEFTLALNGQVTWHNAEDNAAFLEVDGVNGAVNLLVKNTPERYDLRIIKKDETGINTITATARFAILNANGEIISGQQANTINGIANFANTNGTHFAPGNYKLREINAPDNYVRITEDLPFTIGEDGRVTMTIPENSPYRDFVQVNVNREGAIPVIEFNVKNDPRSWNLIIRKRDKVEAGNITNVGELDRLTKKPIATFELLHADGSPFTPRKVDTVELISKPQGYVRFNDIKPGRYKLRETGVPAGYATPAADLEFTLAVNGQVTWHNAEDNAAFLEVDGVNGAVNLLVKNTPERYDLRIIKKDETGINTITATARFAILNANGEIISGQQANTINGIANFANTNGTHFGAGTYKLREVNPPDNYLRITEDLPFTISEDGTVAMNIPENSPYRDFVQVNVNRDGAIPIIEFSVKNDPRPWNLIIRKRDKVEAGNITNVGELDRLTKKPIATFELLYADGSPFTPRKVDTVELTSKPQGYVRFDNIKPGRYKLRETEVPAGYETPTADLEFTLAVDGRVTWHNAEDNAAFLEVDGTNGAVNLLVKNTPKRNFNLVLLKRDKAEFDGIKDNLNLANDPRTALSSLTKLNGARFELLSEDGSSFNPQKLGDTANGELIFTDIAPGHYKLREVTPPTGYIGLASEYAFEVLADGTIVEDAASDMADKVSPWEFVSDTREIFISITNAKKPRLRVRKVDAAGELIRGAYSTTSARFIISQSPDGNPENTAYSGQKADLPNGEFVYGNSLAGFPSGQYYLREVRAPQGYIKLFDSIPFYVTENGEVIIPSKQDESGHYVVDTAHPTYAFIQTRRDTTDGSVIIIDVINKRVEYPKTGGMGDIPYLGAGLSLILYALYYGLFQRKRE